MLQAYEVETGASAKTHRQHPAVAWTSTSSSYNKESPVTPDRLGSAVVEFPSDPEIITTRELDAPLELVFDVLTKPDHVRNWFRRTSLQRDVVSR